MPAERVSLGYFDTSVLVKSYLVEPGTSRALALLRRHALLSSALAPIELVSAIRRHRAHRRLTDHQLTQIESRIQEDRPHWTLLELDSHVLGRAESLTRTLPVRTLDALHLASALVFQGETGLRPPFITADAQQRGAGEVLGLEIVFVQ